MQEADAQQATVSTPAILPEVLQGDREEHRRENKIHGWKCFYTHDGTGKPLPSFILNGSVAYAPMIPKVWPFRGSKFTA